MAISLGGVSLCNTLIWVDSYAHSNLSYSRRITLLGKVILQSSPNPKKVISLETVSTSGGSIGYFTKDQLDQLAVFEEAMTQIVFIYNAESLNVVIQPGGIGVSPVAPRNSPDNTDYYTGAITLIEI